MIGFTCFSLLFQRSIRSISFSLSLGVLLNCKSCISWEDLQAVRYWTVVVKSGSFGLGNIIQLFTRSALQLGYLRLWSVVSIFSVCLLESKYFFIFLSSFRLSISCCWFCCGLLSPLIFSAAWFFLCFCKCLLSRGIELFRFAFFVWKLSQEIYLEFKGCII